MISHEQMVAVSEKAMVEPEIVRGVMARVPPSWTMVSPCPDGGMFRRGSVQVIFTVARYGDGRIWVHASLCGRMASGAFVLPDWDEVKRVKHDFVGPDRWSYQVFPSEKEYINENPCVLHLFALLNGEPALPDFTWGLGTL
jgi:hypothetical protein